MEENLKPVQEKRANTHGGRRRWFEPTAEERLLVEKTVGFGLRQAEIASLIRGGIDAGTLRKHFPLELKRGGAVASAAVAEALFQKAMKGDVAACIWWQKRDDARYERKKAAKQAKKQAFGQQTMEVTPLLQDLAKLVRGDLGDGKGGGGEGAAGGK